MANTVSDLLARVKATRKKILDSTDLDEKAIEFFRPKTGTLATAGRNVLNTKVDPRVVSAYQRVNPLSQRNLEIGKQSLRNVAQQTQYSSPKISTLANMGANTIGAGQFGLNKFNQANQNSMRAGFSPIKQASAVAQAGYGLSALPAAFTPSFQLANIVSSTPAQEVDRQIGKYGSPAQRFSAGFMRGMTDDQSLAPNVQAKTTKIPIIGDVDPVAGAGQMIGFTRNPLNKGLFGATENISLNVFRKGNKLSKLGNFLSTNAVRGGIEDFLMSLDDIPENATVEEKAKFILSNVVQGAASEITMRGVGSVSSSGKNKLASLFDSFKKETKTNNTIRKYIRNQKGQFSKTGSKVSNPTIKQLAEDRNLNVATLSPSIRKQVNDYRFLHNITPKTKVKLVRDLDHPRRYVNENAENILPAFAGVELYQDENGEWQYRFNPAKAAAGMAVMGGIKAVKGNLPTKGVEAGNIPLKKEATAKLSNLMNYPQRLAQMGYSAKEIESISAPKAKEIIDNGIFASTNQGRRISGLQSVSQAPASLRQTMDTPLQTQGQKGLDSLYNPLDRRQPLQTQPQQRIKINSKQQLDPTSEKIIQQAKSQIGSVGSDPKKSIRQIADDFYTQWVNRFAPIERVADKTKVYLKSKKAELRPENDPTYLLRRLTGAGGIADARYQSQIKPLVSRMDELGIEKGDLDVYLANRRIAGFGKAGRDIYGADPVKAQRVVLALDQKYGPELSEIASEFYKYQDEGLDELVRAGFITEADARAMRSNNPDYAPLQRVMDEVEEFLGLPTRKTMQGSQPIQRIKGSKKQILSPLESIIANTYSQRAAIEKNNVARSIVELQNILDLGFRKVKQAGDDTITVWRDGQKEYWQVGTDIAETAKGLNEENMNAVLKILQAPASLLRQGATGRNPDFMIPNIVRDQLDAAITSKYGYIPFVDYTRGLFEIAKKDINTKFGTNFDTTIYDKWANSGANIDLGELSGRKSIQQSFDAKANKKRLLSWIGDALDFMGRYSEQPTRVGLFKKAYEKTGNELLSVMESRDSTVDFARMGSKMKVANSIIPFLNVGVQGFDKLIRSVKSNPKKVALNMAIYGALPAATTTLYNLTYFPEEYSEIPQYEKDANFVLVTGRNDDGTVDYFTIPKGNILPVISNPVESFLSYMAGQDQQTFGEFATQFISSTLPVVGDGSSLKEVGIKTIGSNLPQLIKPAAENLLNKSFWKYDTDKEESKEIVPYYLKNKEPYQQAYDWTPATYKAIGAALNVSPLQVQNLMEGYLAGYVKVPNNIIASLQNIADGKEVSKNEIPILRRFTKTTYPSSASKKKVEQTKTTPFMQRMTGQASAAETGLTNLPESTDDLAVLYKDAERIIGNYQENKVKSQYGLVSKDLEEYQGEVDAAIALRKQIEKERPEEVFNIKLDVYKSGGGKSVEERADWVFKTLENVSEDKLQDTINKMWEAKVLTTGASGVAAYLEDQFGIELKYTGSDAKIKKATSKKGKKISIKSSRAKLNLAGTVKAPQMVNFRGSSKINTSNLLKFNATPPKVYRAAAPKLKFIKTPTLNLKSFDNLSK